MCTHVAYTHTLLECVHSGGKLNIRGLLGLLARLQMAKLSALSGGQVESATMLPLTYLKFTCHTQLHLCVVHFR